jgi:Tfp pilus assembly protein PilO
MDKLKQYVLLTLLVCLIVLAAGWSLLVSPKRSDAAALKAQAASQASANAQLENQLRVFRAQAKDLPKQQAKLAAVAAKIPSTPALPALVRALTTASKSAGVELLSVAPGTPVLATTAASGRVAAPGAATSGAATSSSSSAGSLATIPVTLNVVGGYFQVEQFVSALENLPRAMRISNIAVAPGTNPVKPGAAPITQAGAAAPAADDGKSLTTAITGQVFMAANRPAGTAVVVPGAAAAGPGAPAGPAN